MLVFIFVLFDFSFHSLPSHGNSFSEWKASSRSRPVSCIVSSPMNAELKLETRIGSLSDGLCLCVGVY
uniref:Putative secreted protein n=1 Tax=Anopheles darlingi TaxID=43151 RepID=A0A2M4DQZ9_ANODA